MKPPVGGQAVIEGVMMQNGDRIAVAVRRQSDGRILVQSIPGRARFRRLGRIPFVRGIFRMIDMLTLGLRALNLSTQLAYPEEEQMSKGGTVATFAVSIVIAVGAFIILPLYVANAVPALRLGNSILFNLAEGGIRLALFFAYLLAISRMKDIHRVFQYHGAEHKVVYTYEADEALTVENARKHTTLHPRCGTAFLMTVFFIAVLVFSLAGNPTLWLKIVSRLLLLPVVAGISYEFLRFTGRHFDHLWVRILAQPGLWLQRLTTAEPTDEMVEVAIASLERTLEPAPGD
ncbi:MAG: DUF1385 domain-containing protein [Candidatus Bipolaricaulis sp.]|nr:DUF1385 domain-containing protein [Candidatus Bipolaricaulis sp.]MDD5220224.1 DUF1385 domain-containing protein [Candidatus Bipolaricaulis sp.]MDD5647155.1 DUF1385 domain-containing protein [Candidatus Bipolaricaulis sp.]